MADVMAAYGFEPPEPYPANRRAWSAFVRVLGCMHTAMGTLPTPNWTDIRTVLELYDLWCRDVQERLVICFNEVRAIAAEAREETKRG